MGAPGRDLAPGAHIDPVTGEVTFVVAAVPGLRPVRVWFHLRDFGADPVFRRRGAYWIATMPPPPVDRLEYLLVVRDRAGDEAMVVDPANPTVAPGVFGDHSVLTWPDYRPPAWLGQPPGQWSSEPVRIESDGVTLSGELRTPDGAGAGDPMPLLVVHDGPEYARYARLLDHLDSLTGAGSAPCWRVLLLQPTTRNADYSANPAYADALVTELLPTVGDGSIPVVGVGASLGALALLHAAVRHPGTFDGLFLQSGSFFLPRFDAHEKRFEFFDRVVAFVAGFDVAPDRLHGLRAALTAGEGEENLDNNRALAARLTAHGVPTTLTVGRDGHNYTAWRDLLAPSLAHLLTDVTHAVARSGRFRTTT
jgi:enterochelin esterase family protein